MINKVNIEMKIRGFTLVELMIVVSIIGILSALAYPSYLEQVYKAKRSSAAEMTLRCAAILERRFTVNNTYTNDACDNLTNDDYTMVIVSGDASPNGNFNSFVVTTTASSAAMLNDEYCRALTYNNLGVRAATDSGGADARKSCWRS